MSALRSLSRVLYLASAHLTITERGSHVRNFLLCRRCTQAVRDALARRGNNHRDGL